MDQRHYVGLDVSLETTSICVVDQTGSILWRGKCSTEPEAISQTVRTHAPAAVRVGLETGQMSNWLTLQLRKHGLPVVCLDARHKQIRPTRGPTEFRLIRAGACPSRDEARQPRVLRCGSFGMTAFGT